MEAILALSQYLHKQVWRLKGTDLLMSSSEVPKCDFKNKSECVINWLLLIQSFALSDFEITLLRFLNLCSISINSYMQHFKGSFKWNV